MTDDRHPHSPCEVNYRQFSIDTKRKSAILKTKGSGYIKQRKNEMCIPVSVSV